MNTFCADHIQKKRGVFTIPVFSAGDVFLFVIFFLSLQRFGLNLNGTGVSASYFFLLLLIFHVRKVVISVSALPYFFVFTVIFLAGFPELILQDFNYQIRTIASFLAFISPLFLLFVKFEKKDMTIFTYATILSCIGISMQSIMGFLIHGTLNVFRLKGLIGSQRYGFILCLGFFLTLYHTRIRPLPKFFIASIITMGMALTFSRSTVVALFAALAVQLFSNFPKSVIVHSKFKMTTLSSAFLLSSLFVLTVFYLYEDILRIWNFFNTNLIESFLDGRMAAARFDPASSEGYRIYIFKQIMEYISDHPFFGSCYSGLYLLFAEYGGEASVHNQYMDVLLRTGLIGFGFYIFLLFKLMKFYWKECHEIFYGLVAILVYGLVHETFKLGYGAFIFGFLFSYQFWMNKERILNTDFCHSKELSS